MTTLFLFPMRVVDLVIGRRESSVFFGRFVLPGAMTLLGKIPVPRYQCIYQMYKDTSYCRKDSNSKKKSAVKCLAGSIVMVDHWKVGLRPLLMENESHRSQLQHWDNRQTHTSAIDPSCIFGDSCKKVTTCIIEKEDYLQNLTNNLPMSSIRFEELWCST